jgi:SAM-dependent methyltransferase
MHARLPVRPACPTAAVSACQAGRVPRASLDKRPDEVAAMFDAVAARYDLTNDVLSAFQDRRWRRAVVRAVAARPGDRVLDLAAGTGTSSQPFAELGATVVPCDLSLGMLAVGKQARPGLPFTAGDATRLPVRRRGLRRGDDLVRAAQRRRPCRGPDRDGARDQPGGTAGDLRVQPADVSRRCARCTSST